MMREYYYSLSADKKTRARGISETSLKAFDPSMEGAFKIRMQFLIKSKVLQSLCGGFPALSETTD